MKPVVEISMSIISQMLGYLSRIGVNTDPFLEEAGIDRTTTDCPDSRVSIQQFYCIQEKALYVTGDTFFGLHLGESVEAGNWSILGYIVMNCSTLSGALERMCRYEEVVGNFVQTSLSVGKGEATLSFDIKMPDSKNIRHCYEASVSSVVNMIRAITGKEIKLRSVTFQHDAPENRREHDRILGSSALFGQVETTIVFDRKDLETPIAMHNPGLLELFEQHAKNLIDLANSENYYTRKVNALILKWLADGTPGIDRVAKELSLSVRSLQTKLNEEGVTFRKLLENIRKELSTGYLKDRHFSIDDITYLLGFSEPSIFRKTFKKWTGVTPGYYRRGSSILMPESKVGRTENDFVHKNGDDVMDHKGDRAKTSPNYEKHDTITIY